MDRVRNRIGDKRDKRVLALVKAFLKAGILCEDGTESDTDTGTPQGSLCTAAHNPPYEQRWVMRSVERLPRVGAVVTTERCA
jgi:RNA-directed DNA polymerase